MSNHRHSSTDLTLKSRISQVPIQVWFQVVGLCFCAALLLVQVIYYWPQTIDDSYITFRFARNLIEGHGFAYNPHGEAVEGFTNPSWLLLSAASIWLRIDPMLTTKLIGTLCSLALLVMLNRASAWVRDREDAWNCCAPLIAVANPTLAFWSVQGMETPLNTLCVFATWIAFFLLLKNKRDRAGIIFPLLVWASVFNRIDALWFFLGLPVLALAAAFYRSVSQSWKPLLIQCAVAAAGLLLFEFVRLSLFGDFLPNTLYAKTDVPFAGERAVAQLTAFYFQFGLPTESGIPWGKLLWMNIVLLSLGFVLFWAKWEVKILIFIPLLLQAFFMFFSNGDWMPNLRFFQVSVPFIALAASIAFSHLAERLNGVWRKGIFTLGVILLLGCSIYHQQKINVVYIFSKDPLWFPREKGWVKPSELHAKLHQGWALALAPISLELAKEIPDGSSVLMSDIGLPGWLMPEVSIVDVDGLTNRDLAFAPSIRKPGATREGQLTTTIQSLFSGPDAPEYVLAFEQHFGNGPSIPGNVYPQPVALATKTERFQEYDQVWHGVKAEGDVWNHLYRHKNTEPISQAQHFERIHSALETSPGLGFLLIPYVELSTTLEREPLHLDSVFMRSLDANGANREVIFPLLSLAATSENAPLALLLEDFTHPTLKTPLWQNMLLTAYKQCGLELEVQRLEEKINAP